MSDCPMCAAGNEPKHTRTMHVVMEDLSVKALSISEEGHRIIQQFLFIMRAEENQRRTATRFRRRMRSIRATRHLVRR